METLVCITANDTTRDYYLTPEDAIALTQWLARRGIICDRTTPGSARPF